MGNPAALVGYPDDDVLVTLADGHLDRRRGFVRVCGLVLAPLVLFGYGLD